MKKEITNAIVMTAVLACCWFWKIEGLEGLGNIVIFLTWLAFIFSIPTIFIKPEWVEEKDIQEKSSFMKIFSATYTFIIVTFLVYYDEVMLGVLYSVGVLLMRIYVSRMLEAKKKGLLK